MSDRSAPAVGADKLAALVAAGETRVAEALSELTESDVDSGAKLIAGMSDADLTARFGLSPSTVADCRELQAAYGY